MSFLQQRTLGIIGQAEDQKSQGLGHLPDPKVAAFELLLAYLPTPLLVLKGVLKGGSNVFSAGEQRERLSLQRVSLKRPESERCNTHH